MSTRAHIGILNNDGTVREIYHHWDGYLEHLGTMLINYYDNEEAVNKLLDLGDMSIIGKVPVGIWGDGPKEYCQVYRERGEDDVDARTHNSVDSFLDNCTEDYTYLFKYGEWYFRQWDDRELQLVEDGLNDLEGKGDENYD